MKTQAQRFAMYDMIELWLLDKQKKGQFRPDHVVVIQSLLHTLKNADSPKEYKSMYEKFYNEVYTKEEWKNDRN